MGESKRISEDLQIIDELMATEDESSSREAFEYIECYPQVHSEFEEGGRWSNYSIEVYRIGKVGSGRYFKVEREVPASEAQDGMDLDFELYEVSPKEKTVIVYE